MGNKSSSTSIIRNYVEQNISVLTNITQECGSNAYQNVDIKIVAKKGSKVVIDQGLDISQILHIDIKCMQETKVQNDIENKMKEIINSNASVVGQTLGIKNKSATKSITESFVNLSTLIKNEFLQKCIPVSEQSANIELVAEDSSEIVATAISVKQFQEIVVDCLQSSEVVNKAIQDLDQKIIQSAEADSSLIGSLVGKGGSGSGGGSGGGFWANYWWVVLLIVLVILVGLYYYFQQSQKKKIIKRIATSFGSESSLE